MRVIFLKDVKGQGKREKLKLFQMDMVKIS